MKPAVNYKKLKNCLPVLLLVGSTSVDAQILSKVGGNWFGKVGAKSLEMNVITLNSAQGHVAAEIVVSQPGCSGGIAGVGQIKGTVLMLSQFAPDREMQACTVTVNFDSKGTAAKLMELGCADYMGRVAISQVRCGRKNNRLAFPRQDGHFR